MSVLFGAGILLGWAVGYTWGRTDRRKQKETGMIASIKRRIRKLRGRGAPDC